MAGCAFLKYETKEQALDALEAINGKHKMEVCIFVHVSAVENQRITLNIVLSFCSCFIWYLLHNKQFNAFIGYALTNYLT